MKLVSLKLTKKEQKEKNSPCKCEVDQPDYPYGTQIDLWPEVLEKILGVDKLQAGDVVMVHAKAKVTRVVLRDTDDKEDTTRELTIQLTDMGIERDGEDEFEDGFKDGGKN